MKAYGGVMVWLHSLLTSEWDGDDWSASCCGCFNPGKRALVPNEEETVWALEPFWVPWISPALDRCWTVISHMSSACSWFIVLNKYNSGFEKKKLFRPASKILNGFSYRILQWHNHPTQMDAYILGLYSDMLTDKCTIQYHLRVLMIKLVEMET